VHRVGLFLFPFFALLNHEGFLSSEVLPLVFLLVVLFVQDFEQGFLDGLVVAQGFVGVVAERGFVGGQERVEQLLVYQFLHHLAHQPNREHLVQVNRVYLGEPKTVAHEHFVLLDDHSFYGRQHFLAVHQYLLSGLQFFVQHPNRKTCQNDQ
jgi:hypothetical protein